MNNWLLDNITQIKILSYNDELQKFDARNQNITNIAKPISDNDAINYLTLKEYCFKKINTEINTIKADINRLYDIIKYTDIDSLDFSKLNFEEDLKEKIIYFKNIINTNTELLNEFIFKYESLEKKTTLLEFKKISLENQIDELQEQIISLHNEQLKKNKLTYVEEDIKVIYTQLKEYFNTLYQSTKLNFDKIYIDINFLNDKNTEMIKIIYDNKKKIDNISKNNKEILFDTCLYKIHINKDNIYDYHIKINNIKSESIIKPFIFSKLYDSVKLYRIKYALEQYDDNGIKIDEKYIDYLKLLIDKHNINLTTESILVNLDINIEDDFIKSIVMPNIFKNNKKVKSIILHIILIFKINLF